MAEAAISIAENEGNLTADELTILFVDDEKSILSSLRRLFRTSPYKILIANSGAEGLELFKQNKIDLVVSDMRMPQMDGAQFLTEVANKWPETIRILLTGYSDLESTIAAVNQGKIYRYLSKPWEENDLRMTIEQALEKKVLEKERDSLLKITERQNDELKKLNNELEKKVEKRTEQLRNTFHDVISIFTQLVELREKKSVGHSRRVASLSKKIANKLNLDKKQKNDIYIASLLHDLGKVGLSDGILKKYQCDLTEEEQALLEKHAVTGPAILMSLPLLENAANMIRSHHERFDGKGYPDGLTLNQIPMGSRIIMIANDFDNLLTGISNGKPINQDEAVEQLKEESGKAYDPNVFNAFCQVIKDGYEQKVNVTELMVTTEELQAGMVLIKDLITPEGLMLLSSGLELTEQLISKIKGFEKDQTNELTIHVNTKKLQ